jgi:hypothetical protein
MPLPGSRAASGLPDEEPANGQDLEGQPAVVPRDPNGHARNANAHYVVRIVGVPVHPSLVLGFGFYVPKYAQNGCRQWAT